MSDNKKVDNTPEDGQLDIPDTNIAVPSCEVSSIAGSVKTGKTQSRVSSSSERQIKFERAQKCLENAALVSKRIKEHRKATAELLGRPFEDDDGGDAASEMASTVSEITGYSVATNTSTTLSVQDALNIPGISESLANTLKQKEILMERIKQYKEISKRPITKPATSSKREKVDMKMVKNTSSSEDVNQLQNTIKEKENALSVLQVKMKAMETTILDLQEKNNEKDQIIEAKNLATTLMSDSLSKKEKDTLDLLEDTRQQMTKMQENFISMEAEWHNEKEKLLKEIEARDERIISLEEANTILENSRFEISIAHSKLSEELENKNKDILELQLKLEKIQREGFVEKKKDDTIEEKGVREIADMTELTKKVELLEQLNCQIRQTNKELENKLATCSESKSAASTSPIKKGSPLTTRKNVRNPGFKKSPWSNLSSESLPEVDKKSNKTEVAKLEMVIKSLNKDLLDKEYVISQRDALISDLQITNSQNVALINNLQNASVTDKHAEVDTVEIGTNTEVTSLDENQFRSNDEISNPETNSQDVKDLEEKLKAAENQVATLNEEINAANKNMLKVKSAHKLKLKQMQKTIDNLSKISDANAEIVKLNEELHQLTQKVAELEEEKGNLQLHLVDYDSARLTDSEIYSKMLEMEHLAETRLKAISILEAQKFDLVQELHDQQQKNAELEDKLADMSHLQSEQVSSEMNSVQLEEQIDQLLGSKKELEVMVKSLKSDKEQLNSAINLLIDEKEEINQKLETYIQENIELTDKLEKLSAEKVSSAESIEIVESLTTQEKLELEEYNKGIIENKTDNRNIEDYKESESNECADNLEKLVQESAELNKKVELFTQERQEVMEKMNRISTENDALQEKIFNLNIHCNTLQTNIDVLKKEKQSLQTLNEELNTNIENLKRERIDIIQESVELIKPVNVEDPVESSTSETPVDDKLIPEKGINRTKSVKQLTKEILKLKNTIKDREAEIADSQMKILSLEEQQQKHMELLHSNMSFENKIKNVVEENNQLKEVIESLRKDKETEDQILKYNVELQKEVQRIHQEYSATISTRDHRIKELESLLLDYERQIFNYANTVQEKDKEMAEYINQVTKLNDVSQKLRSTVELLEEEKAKNQNAELMKSLHKQISAYQKKLIECEEKIKILEEEKVQIQKMKNTLENKNAALDSELSILQDSITEKQNFIKELQRQQQKHTEEMSSIALQSKEREEEIHEIKLQLRKESIENEKLRTNLSEMTLNVENFTHEFDETKNQLNIAIAERDKLNEQNQELDSKNKELLEKLRKFAANLKKKSAKNVELERQISDIKQQLSDKIQQTEQLSIQVETITPLQEKIKYAEEEVNRLQLHRVTLEQQKCNDLQSLQAQLVAASDENLKLNEAINSAQAELNLTRSENTSLILQIETLGKKLAEHEIEQKNNTNYITKINTLETDIIQKQNKITDLVETVENLQQQLNQIHFGQDAKIQERDLFIETLETEISKYKKRICRLEESISIMEDRRHSLERKADQLGSQLQEKQKAYTEYASQEDELVSRLAVLIDHDRVVEKQLHVIETENKELLYKIQHLSEENQRLRKSLSEIQEQHITLFEKASRTDKAEVEIDNYKSKLHELENNFKRISHEHQTLLVQKQRDIEELETEFNVQIENAIKEKKVLSEKYEKVAEHITQLENKLQEQNSNAESLNIHLNELTRINQELSEKVADKGQSNMPDYTEQYVSEINKLNAVLNQRNCEIQELNNKLQHSHMKDPAIIKILESQVSDLSQELLERSNEVNQMAIQISTLKKDQEGLQDQLSQRDLQIQQLIDKKTVSFEMNIPKTEGMIISSTIEALNEEKKTSDIASIESQILTELPAPSSKKDDQQKKIQQDDVQRSEVNEPIIVPKKAYLCYKGEEDAGKQEADPFNSEEGWGLDGYEELGDVTPGLFHLNKQILELKEQNERLKTDLHASNTKLTKALKKLKELKNNNEMLANELKISKQISQTAFLENAIEDELKNHIQELEKKIKELDASFNKEKREKEALQKQNEVFTNANEKLTEMKEKMDSEVEFWKFKFKEASDKMSTLEWGADSPQHKITERNVTDTKLREEILKLDKENEELQLTVDRLTEENKRLSSQQVILQGELNDIKQQLAKQTKCENCTYLNTQLIQLQDENKELSGCIDSLKFQLSDFKNRCDTFKSSNEELQIEIQRQNDKSVQQEHLLKEELESLKQRESDNKIKIESLNSELEAANLKVCALENNQIENKSQLHDTTEFIQKCRVLEDLNLELKEKLEKAYSTIRIIETEKEELTQNYSENNARVNELNEKIQNLNNENDNLLSTVTELRSSIASAVDQRGFEIAELWKQHLSQREADFQKTEHELREQLNQWESKYENIIDTIQSNTLEQTNKEIYSEHLNTLQNKLIDKEEHLKNLQEKYAEVMNQMDNLRSEIEDEKLIYENKLLEQQEEYEKQIQDLSLSKQQHTEEYESLYKNINSELATSKTINDELSLQIKDLTSAVAKAEAKVTELTNELRSKDSEIYQKTHDYTLTLSQRNEEFEIIRKQLLEYERKIEDLSYEKEADLAVLRLKMHEKDEKSEMTQKELEIEKARLTEAYNAKVIECTNLNKQIAELNKVLEEHSNRTMEMQTALETQELEIVTLKDNVLSLQDMLRQSSSKVAKHVTFATDTKPVSDVENVDESLNKELLDAVPRAELDLALYMLHQRDVRCEELTMELTQLLEERDTLQLRLSDSLRSYEEMKSKSDSYNMDASKQFSGPSEKSMPIVDIHRAQTSRSSSVSDPEGDKPKLQAKLSELRSVRHSRDVILRHDSEQRQLDMRLLQRDVAHLPQEAVEQLAQAHHTLSRDTQSTPTVLLNWLRGKSTPKVVHM